MKPKVAHFRYTAPWFELQQLRRVPSMPEDIPVFDVESMPEYHLRPLCPRSLPQWLVRLGSSTIVPIHSYL